MLVVLSTLFVFISAGAMVKRVYLDKLQDSGQLVKVQPYKTKRRTPALDLAWSKEGDGGGGGCTPPTKQTVEMFDVVSLNLVSNPSKPLEILAVLNRPTPSGEATA